MDLSWRNRGRLVFRLLRDRRVPLLARAIIPLLVLYLLSPIDLIPDFIPVLGYADDLLVLALAVWAFAKLADPAIVREHASRLMREAGVGPIDPSLG
ncbi:MAG: DUF1232 domain-containing protein [Chloroflexi bacterium]|nr:DUF1232 domain-containing protein [Chloroflexota bacterium]